MFCEHYLVAFCFCKSVVICAKVIRLFTLAGNNFGCCVRASSFLGSLLIIASLMSLFRSFSIGLDEENHFFVCKDFLQLYLTKKA